jgi:hypothetical protein
MEKELQAIFEKIDSQYMSDELKQTLAGVFEEAVEKRLADRLDLELKAMDETHAEQTTQLIGNLEATFEQFKVDVDADHSEKIQTVAKALSESYGQKLLIVKEGYEKVIRETALEHRTQLVGAVEKHLNIALEKIIPAEQVREAAKNTFAQKQLDEARKVLGVDKAFMSANVKEGIVQGKNQIDALIKENANLKKAKLVTESENLLVKATANLPVEQAKYVRTKLEGRSPEFIKDNLSYVLEMYARQESQEKASLLREHAPQVDRVVVADELNRTSYIEESSAHNPLNPNMGMYMRGLNYRK